MQTWFEVKVKYEKVDQDGRERKVSESYLVDAVSFTDAEARITEQIQQMVRGEYNIDNIRKSNIIEIFPADSGEFWYKAKISLVTIDEKAGKEKKINNFFLIAADDLKEALSRLEEGLSYMVVPYYVTGLNLSNIVDVFPYSGSKSIQVPGNLKPVSEIIQAEEPEANEENGEQDLSWNDEDSFEEDTYPENEEDI